MTGTPPAPQLTAIPQADTRKVRLLENVQDALRSIGAYFDSGTHIEGLEAGDLFNLNSVLGSSIEVQVVETLNRIRKVWDPDDEWPEHKFERSSQTFPDVRLVARTGGTPTVDLGIELKGWYLLSKEGEPSFRYRVTPAVCSPFDLLVVVPWHLKNVLSGVPVIYQPFITQARYAAERRNYWWQYERGTTADTTIVTSPGAALGPYPPPKSKINDSARSDSGNNFGRIGRIGVMDDYVEELLSTQVSGVEASHWVSFFKLNADAADRDAITARLARDLARVRRPINEVAGERIATLIKELGDLMR